MILGVMASAPVVCASFAVFAEQALRLRLLISLPPVIVLTGLVFAAFPHAPIVALAYAMLFVLSVMGFGTIRLLLSWRFQEATVVGTGDRHPFRYSLKTLLIGMLVASAYVGVIVLLASRPGIERRFLTAYALLFPCGAVASHALCLRRHRVSVALVLHSMLFVGFLVSAKFTVVNALPRGPGVGSPNIDLLGPCTIGFTLGALGVQYLYLLLVRVSGWRLTAD